MTLLQRTIALLTILAIVGATAGLPLPAADSQGTESEDFPCKGHACGCHTAKMCRTACCCFPRKLRPESPPCCHSRSQTDAKRGDEPSDTESSFGWIIGALKCRGDTAAYISHGIVMIAPHAPAGIERDRRITFRPQIALNIHSGISSIEPPTPPPRA